MTLEETSTSLIRAKPFMLVASSTFLKLVTHSTLSKITMKPESLLIPFKQEKNRERLFKYLNKETMTNKKSKKRLEN